ncbi:MAG: hypothetical protein ACI9HK_001640, partial [Pirellulaceae bacterium]
DPKYKDTLAKMKAKLQILRETYELPELKQPGK